MATNRISAEKLEELKKRLVYLETEGAKEVAEHLKEARSYGDLSENSEYDEAKTEQGKLYSEIAEIKNIIENAEIIEEGFDTDKVSHGNTVTVVEIEDGEEGDPEEYKIVGSQEADPMNGMLSEESPIGKALMGRAIGDVVTIEAPDGVFCFKITAINR